MGRESAILAADARLPPSLHSRLSSLDREVTVRDESTNGSDAMTKPRISQVLLWILALVTLALFGFFVALVAGAIPVGEPKPPRDTGALSPMQTEPARPAGSDQGDEARATDEPPPRPRSRPPIKNTTPPSLATVVVTAARGDAGSRPASAPRTGSVLDERLLAQGESVTLPARRCGCPSAPRRTST